MNGATTDFQKGHEDMPQKQGRLLAYDKFAHGTKRVGWPDYNAGSMPQFEYDTCEAEAAMCCFVDADAKNSQVCHHDIHESHEASRLYRGFAAFDNNLGAQCVGFSWAGNDLHDSFKGNLLAEISYMNIFNDLKTNVPGAPLCGCVEQMPAVTTAKACSVSVTDEAYNIVADSTFPGGLMIMAKNDFKIAYSCDGDLLEDYAGTPEQKAGLEKKLVGACDTDKFLNHYFYQPGSASVWNEPDTTKWKKMMGQGLNYIPFRDPDVAVRNAAFMEVFNTSPNKIVLRLCPNCMPSHQFIYYKRLTPVPSSLNLMDLLMNNWFDTNNVLHTDFELYSTYEEALAGDGGEWQFCNYNDATVGFPRDCGVTKKTNCQWSSHVRTPCSDGDYNTYSHAFYIEIA